ncbi:MAG TPA: STAS domain-containing protein [Macromonas sp.]|nr:STAS domain-containing protein [Macromonas sp.]
MLNLPALPAQMTHEVAQAYLARCEAALATTASAQAVAVDAAALHDFDSTVLAVLLAVRRAAQQRQVTFHVLNLPARLRDLATVYGVSELLPA